MGKIKILCYHGSPGTCEDFIELGKEYDDAQFVPVARKGYPPPPNVVHKEGEKLALAEPTVVLGYSWGCVAALRDVAQSPENVKALVLVAPFLGAEPVGAFKRFLMTNSFIGSLVIGMAANGIVSKLFEKSSRPKKPPQAYLALREKLARFDVLSRAGLEKTDAGMDAREACDKVKTNGIPVLLFWGKQDANDNSQEYAETVKNWLESARVVPIEDGGHALLWTHSKELAKSIKEFVEQIEG